MLKCRYCGKDSLDRNLVKGKIVLCDALNTGEGPFYAGTAGAVMRGQIARDSVFIFPLPASYVDANDGSKIFLYINSTRNATATIFKSTEVNDTLAPYVFSFSSRGPNPITSDILKPDTSAPGVSILAAWSLLNPVSEVKGDTRYVPYNIKSGTSMPCPHATGAAAYIKSFHPSWSPAAIKSALMTTGHINPIKAVNPGLIYDAGELDYLKFLCGQGYNATTLRNVTRANSSCSKAINRTVWDLNYPSFSLSTESGKSAAQAFHRTVTNVGSPTSIYKLIVKTQPGLKIQVQPRVLQFKSFGQKKSFVVRIGATFAKKENIMISGYLVWDDGVHQGYLVNMDLGTKSTREVHLHYLQKVVEGM
ncbi:cucumisin-like [Melia azedarach]|uniref:Cucumisin-like n=1 Tax=Melia azedarach TaxID=155640 RepID=A0ACC1YBR7_MELAZ|nr:cucumisin-like [Melia azedarach]